LHLVIDILWAFGVPEAGASMNFALKTNLKTIKRAEEWQKILIS
jgi:hypothetical protein